MFAVLEAIDECLQKRRLMPALLLLYSAMDAVASLERQPGEGTRAAFTRWVDTHMVKARPLPCTALELYAARCGIVHDFAAESDLSRKGQVRRIFYAWGTARPADLQKATDIMNTCHAVSVHVGDIIDAFRNGVANYLDEVGANVVRQKRIISGSSIWLINIQPALIQAFLDRYGSGSKDAS